MSEELCVLSSGLLLDQKRRVTDLPFWPRAIELGFSNRGAGAWSRKARMAACSATDPIRSQRWRRTVSGLSCVNMKESPELALLMVVRRRRAGFVKAICRASSAERHLPAKVA